MEYTGLGVAAGSTTSEQLKRSLRRGIDRVGDDGIEEALVIPTRQFPQCTLKISTLFTRQGRTFSAVSNKTYHAAQEIDETA